MAIPEYWGERISAEMVVQAAKRLGWLANPDVYIFPRTKEACGLGLVYVDRFGVPSEKSDPSEPSESYPAQIVRGLGITNDYLEGYDRGFEGPARTEPVFYTEELTEREVALLTGYRDGYAAYLACEYEGLFS